MIEGMESIGLDLSAGKETRNAPTLNHSKLKKSRCVNGTGTAGLKSKARAIKPNPHMYFPMRIACTTTTRAATQTSICSAIRKPAEDLSIKPRSRARMENHFTILVNIKASFFSAPIGGTGVLGVTNSPTTFCLPATGVPGKSGMTSGKPPFRGAVSDNLKRFR